MADRFSKKIWWLVRLTLEPEVEELVSTVLWNVGTTGISSNATADTVTLNAYFTEPPNLEQLRSEIETLLAELGIPSAHLKAIEQGSLVEEDWLQQWKEGYHSFAVGERFIITPSWEKPKEPGARIVIEIDPGIAFGTGTHATTQLCLMAIERHWRGGSFLDIGTGTGILAIAAAKLHPEARIVAVDLDPTAIEVARENLIRNGVSEKIKLLVGAINRLRGQRFDLIVANLTAQIIEVQVGQMAELLADDGVLILSGLLAEQEAAMREKLAQARLGVVDCLASDEWLALVSHRQRIE